MTAPEPSEPPAQWVWLARIRRTQGRKGEVFAEILTDFPEKFAERKRLWLMAQSAPGAAPREVELIAHWLHKGGVVLHFAGVDSISAAETLAGLIVAIPLAERAPLAEDEVYVADLIGCTLVDVAGEVLIPFAKSYLRSIDLAGKRVEMALPKGLAELNAPQKGS